jgi:hypothetical protein
MGRQSMGGGSGKMGQRPQTPSYGGLAAGGAGKGRGLGAGAASAASPPQYGQQPSQGGMAWGGGSPSFDEMGRGGDYQHPTQSPPNLAPSQYPASYGREPYRGRQLNAPPASAAPQMADQQAQRAQQDQMSQQGLAGQVFGGGAPGGKAGRPPVQDPRTVQSYKNMAGMMGQQPSRGLGFKGR